MRERRQRSLVDQRRADPGFGGGGRPRQRDPGRERDRRFRIGGVARDAIREQLGLRQHEGNCDLCFLKGYDKIRNIVRDRPDLALWWAEQEARIGDTFRDDRPSYAAMLAQPDLFKDGADDSLTECYCHD